MTGSPSGEPAPVAEPLPPPRRWAVAGLVTAIGVFVWCVGGLAATAFRLYVTSFDLAIYDQATWLVAHGRWPLTTVFCGRLLSTHVQLLIVPLAALYRLVPGPLTLIYVEVVAVAIGAVPVFLLARSLSRSDLVALVWAVLFLDYPAAQYLVLHDFHFQPLGVPSLLFAVWFAHGQRWRPMALMLALAVFAQDDAGLAVACFGLGLFALGHRRVGLLTAAGGLGYTLAAVKLIMPLFNPLRGQAFYIEMYYAHLGHGLSGLLLAPFLRPAAWWSSLSQPANLRLLVALLAPVAALTLAKPSWAIGALGLLYVNMLGSYWPTHSIECHYQGFVIPFVFAAAVGGGAWLTQQLARAGARPQVALLTPPLLALLGTFGLPPLEAALVDPPRGSNYAWWLPAVPTSPLRRPRQEAAWRQDRSWAADCDRLVARIPPGDSVGAPPKLLNHVSGRVVAYRFPAPFTMIMEGFEPTEQFTIERFRAGLERERIDWLLLLAQPVSPAPLDPARYVAAVQAVADSGLYELVEDTGALRLYRRR